jgi:hypothetical protein
MRLYRRIAPSLTLFLAACTRPAIHEHAAVPVASSEASAYERAVQDGYARARAATASYKVLDSAVARGYAATVAQCIADPTHGAMGYHHLNRAYVDNKVEIEKPEILLYERKADGTYGLNGVEYIIPYRVWPKDSMPPRLLGRDMIQSESLQLWYTHMWIWTPNKSGLFADWNPDVSCR